MIRKKEKEEGYAHELCVFLGGDDMAFRISNALRRSQEILTVLDLKATWSDPRLGQDYLCDIRWIGEKAIDRIREKIDGPMPPVMDEDTASWIIRAHMALSDKGIGPARQWDGETNGAQPVDTPETDRRVIEQAVKVAGHLFDGYLLQEAGLL